MSQNSRFSTFHIGVQHRLVTSIDAPQPQFCEIPSVYKLFACEMVRTTEELFAIEKMAGQCMSIKEVVETVSSSSTEMEDCMVSLEDTAQKH